jgi:hypothetical protein
VISWLFLTSFRLSRFINLPTFVDDVPVSALSLVSTHDLFDVVFHYAHQCSIVVDLVHPTRQLTVPNQRMAAHL